MKKVFATLGLATLLATTTASAQKMIIVPGEAGSRFGLLDDCLVRAVRAGQSLTDLMLNTCKFELVTARQVLMSEGESVDQANRELTERHVVPAVNGSLR